MYPNHWYTRMLWLWKFNCQTVNRLNNETGTSFLANLVNLEVKVHLIDVKIHIFKLLLYYTLTPCASTGVSFFISSQLMGCLSIKFDQIAPTQSWRSRWAEYDIEIVAYSVTNIYCFGEILLSISGALKEKKKTQNNLCSMEILWSNSFLKVKKISGKYL